MASIINGVKEPTCGHQNFNTSQILIFGGYVKVNGSLCTQVILWVNSILNHFDTKAMLPRYEGPSMVYTQMLSILSYF